MWRAPIHFQEQIKVSGIIGGQAVLASEGLDPVKHNPDGDLFEHHRERREVVEEALYHRLGNALAFLSGEQGVQHFVWPN
jgi:hypothetical protein